MVIKQAIQQLNKYYERPTQLWLCERHKLGQPCPNGPDRKGRCHTDAECNPSKNKQGSRWFCTRADKCDDGPLPKGQCSQILPRCTPYRSMQYKRKLLTQWLLLLSLGICLFFLNDTRYQQSFVSPGTLSFAHGTIQNCDSCHSSAQHKLSDWLELAVQPPDAQQESKRCLVCHDIPTLPLAAHNIPLADLQQLTEKAKLNQSTQALIPKMLGQKDMASITCYRCHQEHRGESSNIVDVNNQYCQNCHQNHFQSLSDGHPEFTDFPDQAQINIHFDHSKHFQKHFKKSTVQQYAPSDCHSCHQTDASGQDMLVKTFEQACQQCHAKQIAGVGRASTKGLNVLSVPGLDIETLRDNQIEIGEWPEYAENELTPFMLFLLSSDISLQLDLLDLSDANETELKQVEKLAWDVKQLFWEIDQQGQQALQKRIEAALNAAPTTNIQINLLGMLPAEVIKTAQAQWFPHLNQEVENHQQGVMPDIESYQEHTINEVETAVSAEKWVDYGGWYKQDFALYYRPVQHADNFLNSWLMMLSQQNNSQYTKPLFELLTDKKSPGICMKCHTINHLSQQDKHINQPRLTHFSHTAHFSLVDEKGCVTCHELDAEAGYKTMKKSQCSHCHTEDMAGDNCLTCHNYHIMPITSKKPSHSL